MPDATTPFEDAELARLAEELEDRIPAGESFLIAEAVAGTDWLAQKLSEARLDAMKSFAAGLLTDIERSRNESPVDVEEAARRIRGNIEGTYSYGEFNPAYADDVAAVSRRAQQYVGSLVQDAAKRLLDELDGGYDYQEQEGYADAAYEADLDLVVRVAEGLHDAPVVSEPAQDSEVRA